MKAVKFSLQVAITICLYLSTINYSLALPAPIEVSGDITENTIWSADTVKVDSTVTVNQDYTLTVEPGTYIEFQGFYSLNVLGTLRAEGTETEPITFTINDTTGLSNLFTNDGAWHGIRFDAGFATDTSILDFCIIQYCKARSGGGEDTQGGGIRASNNTRLVISNSIIRNSYAHLDGGGIHVWDSYAKIINNKIYNNSTWLRGGGLSVWSSEAVIINNVICNNSADFGGGIKIQSCNPVFANNIICNNEAGDAGGGIWMYSSDVVSINNTICFNKANLGGGIDIDLQSKPVLYNNIIWGNVADSAGNQVYMVDFNPEIKYNNCNIRDGEAGLGLVPGSVYFGDYNDNIDTIPGFVSPPADAGTAYDGLAADWSLSMSSACINKGTNAITGGYLPDTDIGNNRRVSYSEIDIGAYEFYLPSLEACGDINENTTWTADTIKVNCDINVLDTNTLTINAGALVQFQGPYKIIVNGTLLALGTQSDSIVFTVKDTTGFYDVNTDTGGWKGIEFYSYATNDSSKILYSRLEFGKRVTGSIFDMSGGAIWASSCYRLLISNSIITNNLSAVGGGIRCENSPITIMNSTISNNRSTLYYGGGIDLSKSNVNITGCNIVNNEAHQEGGGISIYMSEPTISNCTIRNNTAKQSGGGIYSRINSRPVITGNVISYNSGSSGGGLYLETGAILSKNLISNNQANTGGGIYTDTDEEIILVNNIICNNTANHNGGIGINAGTSKMINNTVVNNFASFNNGGVNAFSPGLTIENSIIWGNTAGNDSDQVNIGGQGAYPDILYSNIQGGIESFGYGESSEYPGRYENNINSLPRFIQPADSAGINFDGTTADWSLLATSASVNAGNPLTDDPDVLPIDFYGNPRINLSIIDMGALENQSGVPVITEQPLNYTKCTGDSVEFSVKVSGDVFYQWQMNQLDIPGATQSSYIIDSIIPGHDGNYQCIIHNAYGIFESNPALLRVKSPPEIISQPGETWVEKDGTSSLRIFAVGTDPGYQWRKNGIELAGEIIDELTIPETGYDHEGSYDCIVNNSCGADTTEPVNLYLAPQICMVTVSPTTGFNLIVWEKKSIAPILAYNIYLESAAAGIYDPLATIPFDDLSVFVDTIADPTVQAYLYKITALDTAGVETDIDLCKPHKTIHLLVTTNPELKTTQLAWDRYHGFDYQTYTIYRSNTGLNFDPVGSLSANLNSWTDPDPSTGDLFYRIAVEKPVPCIPGGGGKKAGTGPYHHSLSNMDDNKLQAGQQPPDTITLNNNSIEEENLPGRMIGKLFTEDKDSLDSHTYKFVPGDGDDDNISFTLMGDLLLASESFDYETKNQYSIRIRSTDEAGNYCEVPFIIQVINVDETTGLPVLNANAVKAFPNPFSRFTSISFPNPAGKSYRMVLTDLSGKVCRIVDGITTSEYVLEKGDLKEGFYFIELRGPKTFRSKIIIE